MKQVFQCDFCSHTSEDSNDVLSHELVCVFNPLLKTCFTCKHSFKVEYPNSFESGYPIGGHEAGCHKSLDCKSGEKGNCKGWLFEKDMEIGSLVKPTEESGFILASGMSWYSEAVVISLEPFILTSIKSDMKWQSTIKIEDFEVIGKVDDTVLENCKRRLQ